MRARDDDLDEDDDRPARRRTPKARVYVHDRCGGATRVSGDDFVHISDPFWPCTGTFCCTCNGFVSLSAVRWEDTDEPVSEYRRRMRAETPALVQAWRFGLGLVPGTAIGAGVGLLSGLAAGVHPNTAWTFTWIGGLIGAAVCYLAGVFILNRVFDIDYRRMR